MAIAPWRPLLAIAPVIAALLATGCVGAAELLRALGKDPVSICVSVATIYAIAPRAARAVPPR